jgi:dTDP-4-dehydrorhamnose reductase
LVNEKYNAGIKIIPSDDIQVDRSLNSDRFRNLTGFKPQQWPDMIAEMRDDAKIYDKFNK